MPYRLFAVKADIEERQQHEKAHEQSFPPAGIGCRGKRRRHPNIHKTGHAKPDLSQRPARRAEGGCDTRIGDPDHRYAFLDRAHTCLLEMLPRAGRVAEPGVIRQVHQHVRPRAGAGRHTWKQRLVTDQDLDQAEMRQCYQLLALAGREIDRTGNGIDEGQDAAKGTNSPKGTRRRLS